MQQHMVFQMILSNLWNLAADWRKLCTKMQVLTKVRILGVAHSDPRGLTDLISTENSYWTCKLYFLKKLVICEMVIADISLFSGPL